GRWIADELAAEGVDLHAAWAEAETRSSLSVAGADEGLTEFYEHGFPVMPEEWAAFAALVSGLAADAAWMTLSGSLPPGAPDDGYAGLIPLTRTALDSRATGIDARPAVVKLNEAEAGVGAPSRRRRRLPGRERRRLPGRPRGRPRRRRGLAGRAARRPRRGRRERR